MSREAVGVAQNPYYYYGGALLQRFLVGFQPYCNDACGS
jgi:hypothetical protein